MALHVTNFRRGKKWQDWGTPFAYWSKYCNALIEEEFIEASVERNIFHLYTALLARLIKSEGKLSKIRYLIMAIYDWALTLFRWANLNVVEWRSLYFRDEGGAFRNNEYSPARRAAREFLKDVYWSSKYEGEGYSPYRIMMELLNGLIELHWRLSSVISGH